MPTRLLRESNDRLLRVLTRKDVYSVRNFVVPLALPSRLQLKKSIIHAVKSGYTVATYKSTAKLPGREKSHQKERKVHANLIQIFAGDDAEVRENHRNVDSTKHASVTTRRQTPSIPAIKAIKVPGVQKLVDDVPFIVSEARKSSANSSARTYENESLSHPQLGNSTSSTVKSNFATSVSKATVKSKSSAESRQNEHKVRAVLIQCSDTQVNSTGHTVRVSQVKIDEVNGKDEHGFPLRRPMVRELSDADWSEIEDWYQGNAVTTGPLLPEELRERYKRVLYTWRDLDAQHLSDIPATDLYTHRVRLKEGTVPYSSKRRIRRTPQQDYWLEKTITEGRLHGMFESTVMANGELSDWNADAVVVEKPGADKTVEMPEMRITFNYSNVTEEIPGMWLNLTEEVHDFLSNPRIKIFNQFDIKHAYWSLPVHKADRHILAFHIPGIGQLQPTRMPQGEQSSGFSMAEVMTIALGPIPALPVQYQTSEFDGAFESLLGHNSINADPECAYYFDDIFGGHETAEAALDFLQFQFFPRMAWAKLRLSFAKMKLFMEKIKALGMLHTVGGIVEIVPSRIKSIQDMKPPKSQTQVRQFLGSIGICRRWIRNYSEIARPLTRLTGKVEWRWEGSEQLSFQFLQEKACSAVETHGWDNKSPVTLYSDASQYGAGCCIVQNRPLATTGKTAEHPIALDSFTFSTTERNYGTYKRELLGIVKFCRKFYYMLRNEETSVIMTDHRPLTYFLHSHLVHGIYSRWAAELQLLNIRIEYVPGEKNEVADALSRVMFPKEDCSEDEVLASLGDHNANGPVWVWKDGKGGYAQLLEARKKT